MKTFGSPTSLASRFIAILSERQLLVAGVFVALLAIALGVKLSLPYEAHANVLLANDTSHIDESVAQTDLPTIATSTVVLERVRRRLSLNVPLAVFKRRVKAKVPLAHSNILGIAYRDTDADLAARVVNGVADELARYYAEISTTRYDQNIKVLDQALGEQKNRLRTIELELQARSRTGNFVPSDEKAMDDLSTQLNDTRIQRAIAAAALAGDRSQLEAVYGDRKTRSAIARHEILQNDLLYNDLLQGASQDGAQLVFDRARFTEHYPGLPGLEARVNDETSAVASEAGKAIVDRNAFSPTEAATTMDAHKASALVDGDRAKLAALDDMIARLRSQLEGIPSVQMLRLERDAAQADYLALSGRRDTLFGDRAQALSLGSVIVIDRATTGDQAFTLDVLRTSFVIAVLAALALASAFWVESWAPRLRSPHEIEALYGSPLLATLGGGR